jgi:hypothetical protein
MCKFKLTEYGRVFYYLANALFQMYLFLSRDRLTV